MHFMAVKKSRKRSVFVINSYTVFERHCIYSQLKGMRTMYVNIYLGYNLSIEEMRKGYSVLSKMLNTCKRVRGLTPLY